jgi:hypothetical protein
MREIARRRGGVRLSERAGWPKPGRAHSTENRTGQAWTQNKVIVFDNEEFRVEIKPLGHFVCPKCDFVVEIDKRGFAFCLNCGIVFNDARKEVMVKKRSRITTRSFIYKAFHKVE